MSHADDWTVRICNCRGAFQIQTKVGFCWRSSSAQKWKILYSSLEIYVVWDFKILKTPRTPLCITLNSWKVWLLELSWINLTGILGSTGAWSWPIRAQWWAKKEPRTSAWPIRHLLFAGGVFMMLHEPRCCPGSLVLPGHSVLSLRSVQGAWRSQSQAEKEPCWAWARMPFHV